MVNRGGTCRRARHAITHLLRKDIKNSTNITVTMSQLQVDLSSNSSANIPWMMVHLSLSLIECLNSS